MKGKGINRRRGRGFSLTDVMVAATIFSGGLLALAQLEVNLTRTGTDAQVRTLASSLAEESLEIQRRFTRTSSDPTGLELAYADIANSTSTHVAGGVTFTLTQTVTEYWWDRDSATFTTTAPDEATVSDFKRVQVSAAWSDALEFQIDESAETSGHLGSSAVSLDTIISSAVTATSHLALIDDINGDTFHPPIGQAIGVPDVPLLDDL